MVVKKIHTGEQIKWLKDMSTNHTDQKKINFIVW